jgi:hypothetical protein
MGLPRAWVILGLLLAPASALASDHQFDLFAAPSYIEITGSSFKLAGWHVSGAAALGRRGWVSLAGDASFHFAGLNDEAGEERTEATFTVGPRFTIPKGHMLRNLFGQVMLLGAVHRSPGDGSSVSAAAYAIGAGYDIATEGMHPWGFRVQVDFIDPFSSDLGHSWRASAGLVYRFHYK